jgi:hypothetical protein
MQVSFREGDLHWKSILDRALSQALRIGRKTPVWQVKMRHGFCVLCLTAEIQPLYGYYTTSNATQESFAGE